MFQPRQVTWFGVKCLALFVLFAIPWPGVQAGYARLYRGSMNLVFGLFGSDGRVTLEPISPATPEHDTKITLLNRANLGMKQVTGNSRVQGYLPTAFTLSLILASPVPWRRRGRAVAWGVGLISVFVALRFLIFLLYEFSGQGGPAFITLGSAARATLAYLYWVLVSSFAGCFLVPVPLWFLVTFRRGDWTGGNTLDRSARERKSSSQAGRNEG